MLRKKDVKIVLEDGAEYCGYSFGAKCEAVCEIVFNTSMVAYQEVLSDPSYTYQMVVMTYPLIGNYGVTDEDFEARIPAIGGLIVRDYNDMPSNFRYTKTLSEFMEDNNIPGIFGVDTRKITRSIRDLGTRKVLITDIDTPHEKAMEILKSTDIPTDAVAKASCKKKWYSRTSNHKYDVVVVDCGIKHNVIRSLNTRGCNVTIVPYSITAEEIEFMKPDGIFISNGPGCPDDVPSVVELIKNLKGKYPIFGICLGHELISLAYGAKVSKLKFGHRGSNHPVKNLETGKFAMVTQNHSHVVDADSLKGTGLEITHINYLDNTVEGVECKEDRIFGVQFHPETAPGGQDGSYLFDKFIDMMKEDEENA